MKTMIQNNQVSVQLTELSKGLEQKICSQQNGGQQIGEQENSEQQSYRQELSEPRSREWAFNLRAQDTLWPKIVVLLTLSFVLMGCGTYVSGPSSKTNDWSSNNPQDQWWNQTPNSMDNQAFQANFMTISVTRMNYNVTENLSVISMGGLCFNPGFSTVGVYYRVYDADGQWIFPADGQPYATNKVFYSGTDRLKASSISCTSQGFWSLNINMPTPLLAQLENGVVEVSIVASYNNQDLYNDATGAARMYIHSTAPDILSTTEF